MLTSFDLVRAFAGALAALVFGFVWYLPPVFGNRWGKLIQAYTRLGEAELNPKNPTPIIAAWFVGCLLNSVVLAFLFKVLGLWR